MKRESNTMEIKEQRPVLIQIPDGALVNTSFFRVTSNVHVPVKTLFVTL